MRSTGCLTKHEKLRKVLNVFTMHWIRYKKLFAIYFVDKIFNSNKFFLKLILLEYDYRIIFLIDFFGILHLKNYGRRHLKLFTNFHFSWDTLYLEWFFNHCFFLPVPSSPNPEHILGYNAFPEHFNILA